MDARPGGEEQVGGHVEPAPREDVLSRFKAEVCGLGLATSEHRVPRRVIRSTVAHAVGSRGRMGRRRISEHTGPHALHSQVGLRLGPPPTSGQCEAEQKSLRNGEARCCLQNHEGEKRARDATTTDGGGDCSILGRG
ncbi:unnamed protein product [Miscanthus lutarioriparius]|nr:unnamed protein product [Miscanthus lutarioriparius]